jgi:hypothetical protein
LQGATTDSGVTLNWVPAVDFVVGYHVYGAVAPNGPFTRLTARPVTGTSYTDGSGAGVTAYMVRAVKLEISGSGSYYNQSQGAFFEPSKATIYSPSPTSRGAHSIATDLSKMDTANETACGGNPGTDESRSPDPRERALRTPTSDATGHDPGSSVKK